MENAIVINSKILKTREKCKNDASDIHGNLNSSLSNDRNDDNFNETNIIMVKPCENPYISSHISKEPHEIKNVPTAFGDSVVTRNDLPKTVVAKIYEGTTISHSSPTTVRHKKRLRPKSAIENHSTIANLDRSLGLCCTLSERSLSPTKITVMPSFSKDSVSISTRPLGIPKTDHATDQFYDKEENRADEEIINVPVHSNNTTQDKIQNKRFTTNVSNHVNHTNRKLLSRRSVDNLVLEPKSPLIHSSPESTRSVPTDKGPYRSTSHDTLTHESVSMDSLARQSLLAAQVLHLIPTTKARERNYLQGRIAVNSLLGPAELERVLPGREVRLFVGTWNMNGQTPPKEMNDFILPSAISHVPDILAIGTQESCSEKFEWEVTLQETIGPTHVLLHSSNLGTLHLALFIRRDLIWFCSLPEDTSMSVRTGSAFRTKGAVAVSFSLFGTTYLFVTAHLTAHQEKVKERVQDIKKIIRSLDLPKNLPIRHKNKDVTQNFDCVFWCGDLNFRLGEPRDKVLQWINDTTFPLPPHMPHGYMHSDQLTAVLSDGAAFKGFKEAQIRFPPTYKYDPGTQRFDTSSKQRAPAYTDRILFKCRTQQNTMNYLRRNSATPSAQQEHPFLECLAYDSVPSLLTSDHKPVWALFKNIIRPGIDTIPLAAGLFNREVYLEGVKRRAASLERSRDISGVCSLQ